MRLPTHQPSQRKKEIKSPKRSEQYHRIPLLNLPKTFAEMKVSKVMYPQSSSICRLGFSMKSTIQRAWGTTMTMETHVGNPTWRCGKFSMSWFVQSMVLWQCFLMLQWTKMCGIRLCFKILVFFSQRNDNFSISTPSKNDHFFGKFAFHHTFSPPKLAPSKPLFFLVMHTTLWTSLSPLHE